MGEIALPTLSTISRLLRAIVSNITTGSSRLAATNSLLSLMTAGSNLPSLSLWIFFVPVKGVLCDSIICGIYTISWVHNIAGFASISQGNFSQLHHTIWLFPCFSTHHLLCLPGNTEHWSGALFFIHRRRCTYNPVNVYLISCQWRCRWASSSSLSNNYAEWWHFLKKNTGHCTANAKTCWLTG